MVSQGVYMIPSSIKLMLGVVCMESVLDRSKAPVSGILEVVMLPVSSVEW